MANGSCLSNALISFLLEVGRDEDATKNRATQRQYSRKFLSFFDNFDLREFSLKLEELTSDTIRRVEEAPCSDPVGKDLLMFVTQVKLGTLRVLQSLNSVELDACRKFVDKGKKLLAKQFSKSVNPASFDSSPNLGLEPGGGVRSPKRPRKSRTRSSRTKRPAVEERESSPEVPIEDISERDLSLHEDGGFRTTVQEDITHDRDITPERPVSPFEQLDGIDVVDEWAEFSNGDAEPSFQLETLSRPEPGRTTRRHKRLRGVDRQTQLSVKFMRQCYLHAYKLSWTAAEHRDFIDDLVSEDISAEHLLRAEPWVERGDALTRFFTEKIRAAKVLTFVEGAPTEQERPPLPRDESDEILHGAMPATDMPAAMIDEDSFNDGRDFRSGETVHISTRWKP
ncbi:uncharacterized protein LOC100902155 [Galendromus occidentalis]|uniref:Uncharacterized protein LOC100902155 n=1 Tax=Galendromus occidentalis TaxID=34638 RepID=A0AAJ6VVH4_9ACAR|nr:uncharacterized protein LOC100902155 [Galendromus occidentalis]